MVFGKKKVDSDSVATLIGAGTTVTGNLDFQGGLHLDGHILGDVNGIAGEPSRLTVGAEGVVEGSVSADELVLLGLVQGNVVARHRVELGATARVDGDVTYQVLQMAAGARVNGRLIHQVDPEGGQPVLPAPDGQDAQEAPTASQGDDMPGLR
jgi:cytoskeletal protein CcmA (bactofilin family)